MKKKNLLLSAIIILGIATATIAQVPSYVPTSGLIGWWPFTGNANDSSGNGNNGTVNGATLTTDRFGSPNSAYSFNGIDNYINCGNITAMNGLQQLSISAWFNATSNIHNSRIIGKEQIANSTDGFDLQFDTNTGNNLATNVRTSGSSAGIDSTLITWGQWYNVVVVFDGNATGNSNRFKMYINGLEDTLGYFGIIPTSTSTNNFECWIGGNYAVATDAPWNGKLDDIGIWSRALTQAEITQLYVGANVGINEFSNDNSLSVFPNPFSTQTTLQTNKVLKDATLTVYNSFGQQVKQIKNISGKTISLYRENLSSGIYFICITQDNTIIETEKIVI